MNHDQAVRCMPKEKERMKKIRLDLDSLKVESFVTNERWGGKEGTVFGMDPNTICDNTCNGVSDTCKEGCQFSDPCMDYTDPFQTTCEIPGASNGCLDTQTCDTIETCEQMTCVPCVDSCGSLDCKPE